jgi:hypothetical protein
MGLFYQQSHSTDFKILLLLTPFKIVILTIGFTNLIILILV